MGGSAGAIAIAILYPLEQLNTRSTLGSLSKARIITTRTIIDDFLHFRLENIADIYRGLELGIAEKFIFNGLYFFFYSALKNQYKAAHNGVEMPMHIALLRGSIAGILTQTITSPLGTIQKILQTSHHEDADNANASRIISNISSKHGISALWSGFGMSMLLVINPAMNVYAYEHIRKHLNDSMGLSSDSALIDFFAGLLSKAIATIICYPLMYIKYSQQAENQNHRKKSVMELIARTYEENGMAGFYQGLRSKIFLSSLSNAMLFMIKEKIVIYTFAMMLYVVNKRKQIAMKRTATQRIKL